MKKSLLLFGFAATTMLASAQQTIYSANNQATFGAWTFADVDGDGNNWVVEDKSTTQGLESQGYSLNSWSLSSMFNPLTPNNYASSPAINCTGYQNISLRFKREAGGAPGAEAEKYSVYALTAANPAALAAAMLTATAIHTELITVGKELVEVTVDLPAALDGMNNVYIVMRHYDCSGQYFLAIDDLVVEGDMIPAAVNTLNKDNVTIFPQPMNGSLNISIGEDIASVTLVDQNGKTVFEKADIASSKYEMNTENLSEGIYILKIQASSGSVYTQKCVK